MTMKWREFASHTIIIIRQSLSNSEHPINRHIFKFAKVCQGTLIFLVKMLVNYTLSILKKIAKHASRKEVRID